jgi:succinate dehydrogenase/fumarate reductase flavoprotein subunit
MPHAVPSDSHEEVDLLVFGAGAAGMTTALVAALEGLSVILCEKTSMVGGTTSTSGGTTWIPGTSQSERDGVPDKIEDAQDFLRSVVGSRGGDELRAAFLASGRAAVDELERNSAVRFTAAKAHPDYVGNHPGAAYGGTALVPDAFDGRLLGEDFRRVRPPHGVFMGLGGMMVARNEIGALLKPFSSLANFRMATSILLRYAADRLKYPRGTRLLMGNALVGQLYYSLRERKVPVLFNSPLIDLLREDGRIVGAVIDTPEGARTIRARRGVVLATGGVAWNKALRAQLFPDVVGQRSQAPEGNTGDGISIAMTSANAYLDDGHDSAALWMPCSSMTKPDGTEAVWPHIILDRAKPGLIAVGPDGRRFVNESDSYHDFCMGMIRANLPEAWLVVDDRFIHQYGLGLVLPGGRGLSGLLKDGYLVKAPNLGELARKIGVEASGLETCVSRHNGFATTGIDEEFGRGSSVMNRFNGDPDNQPNPCMRPIEQAPFYALKVRPIDLAGSAGLRCNENGQVLDRDSYPISGLYACGNDMTSLFRGTYPGPGTTIGPAIVFGWRIAKHAATRLTA